MNWTRENALSFSNIYADSRYGCMVNGKVLFTRISRLLIYIYILQNEACFFCWSMQSHCYYMIVVFCFYFLYFTRCTPYTLSYTLTLYTFTLSHNFSLVHWFLNACSLFTDARQLNDFGLFLASILYLFKFIIGEWKSYIGPVCYFTYLSPHFLPVFWRFFLIFKISKISFYSWHFFHFDFVAKIRIQQFSLLLVAQDAFD